MKKQFKLISLAIIAAGVFAITSCNKEDQSKGPNIIAVSGVSLDKTELKIREHNSETLKASVSPANASNTAVYWRSTDEAVAIVSDNGEVTAVSEGKVTIMAISKDGGYTAECKVTVTPCQKIVYGGITYECKDMRICYRPKCGYDIVFSTEDLPEGKISKRPDGNQFCIDIPVERLGGTTKLAKNAVTGAEWMFFFAFYIGDKGYYSTDNNDLSGTMYFDIDMDEWLTLDMKGTDNFGTEFRVYFNGHPAQFLEEMVWMFSI